MPAHRLDAAALDRAFALATRQVEEGAVPFVILGVANAAGTIRLEAVPPRDGTPIGAAAVCLLASITKPIVTTAVMRLVQDGRFSLTAPLSTWLPELAAAGHPPITAWHVMTHTTGLGEVDIEQLLAQGGGRAELLRRTIALPQDAAPGSRFKYVTCTWELVAEAVERATGTPLDRLLRDEVLDPLGMKDTLFDPRPRPRRADGAGQGGRLGQRPPDRGAGPRAGGAVAGRLHRVADGRRRAVEHRIGPAAVRARDARPRGAGRHARAGARIRGPR